MCYSSVKSTVERKKSLLDEVAEEETELELVMGELNLSRNKRVESRPKKVVKAQSIRSMTGVDEGKRKISREEVLAKTPGSRSSAQPSLTTSKIAQRFLKGQIKKASPASGTTVARLVKEIWLGIEEQESELKKAKSELEKNLARAKMEALKEIRQLKAVHEEVNVIKADTYVEEEEEEADVLQVRDGLDGVSPQTVLDNQGDDVELPEGGSEKALERTEELCRFDLNRYRIDQERIRQKFIGKDDELRVARENLSVSEAAAEHLQTTLPAKEMEFQEMQHRCDDLNERVTQLKAKMDQTIARSKKAKARERSGGSRTMVKAHLVQGDVVSLSGHIRELESNVSRIQGHVQKRNANLRECQHKLDTALIREKFLEGEVKAKELLLKKKEELLKDLPAREELNAELGKLHTQIRDTLLKTLSNKGCTCGAKIDRGNYLGAMETQLGPRTAESIARSKVVVARKLKDRPLDDVGESIADTPSAEKNLL
ncbi:hypothetical protein GIB67_030329 [Kingdonia uniflora]|uniref:Uncharacterized protein n=1 Tax=Kingdonia uniflora TaxID=39325 RepID=A0A7J7M6Z7_9MAGN|nr:hypothetical protein GIB67_030329 [Kingdonia uniflora]